MQADRADRNRPAIRVVSRIPHMLKIHRDRPLFRNLPGVVSLEDILRPIAIQPAIANDEAHAAFGKENRRSPDM